MPNKEEFGWEAWYDAAQWLGLRRVQPVPHAPGGGTPLTCHRVLLRAREEAVARGTEVGPLHLLLELLRDAERPVDEGLSPGELRLRSMLGLPNSGPSPVRPLVEGLPLEVDLELRGADQLPAPVVTKQNVDDKSLWGNKAGTSS